MIGTETVTVEYELSPRYSHRITNEIESGISQIESSQRYSQSQNEAIDSPEAEAVTQELKPVDRGRDAWCTLLGAFAFDALFWGT